MVDFLEGNPDRPLITGVVYNDANMPPYQLPANASVTGLKSRSTKDGWRYNEIRLEDRKGDEKLVIRAERDQEIQVGHDAREEIGNEHHLTVKASQIERIGGDRRIAIQGDREEKVGGTVSLNAQGLVIEADSNITLKVGGGWLVVDQAGVTVSNSPPNAPVINRGSPPLTGLMNLLSGLDPKLTPNYFSQPQESNDPCAEVGLVSEEHVKDYSQDFKQLQKDWPRLGLEARKLQMEAIINKQLAKPGIRRSRSSLGEISAVGENSIPRSGRWYSMKYWMQVPTLSDTEARKLAGTIYHEGRHAKQSYLVARQLATYEEHVNDIAKEVDIPLEKAEAAKQEPLIEGSAQAKCAWKMTDSLVIEAMKHYSVTKIATEACDLAKSAADMLAIKQANPSATQDQIVKAKQEMETAQAECEKKYEAYRQIPHEADAIRDAIRVADRVKALW